MSGIVSAAAATLPARHTSHIARAAPEPCDPIAIPPAMSAAKSCGYTRPNTKSGGCHRGRDSERYQPGSALTHQPAPAA